MFCFASASAAFISSIVLYRLVPAHHLLLQCRMQYHFSCSKPFDYPNSLANLSCNAVNLDASTGSLFFYIKLRSTQKAAKNFRTASTLPCSYTSVKHSERVHQYKIKRLDVVEAAIIWSVIFPSGGKIRMRVRPRHVTIYLVKITWNLYHVHYVSLSETNRLVSSQTSEAEVEFDRSRFYYAKNKANFSLFFNLNALSYEDCLILFFFTVNE